MAAARSEEAEPSTTAPSTDLSASARCALSDGSAASEPAAASANDHAGIADRAFGEAEARTVEGARVAEGHDGRSSGTVQLEATVAMVAAAEAAALEAQAVAQSQTAQMQVVEAEAAAIAAAAAAGATVGGDGSANAPALPRAPAAETARQTRAVGVAECPTEAAVLTAASARAAAERAVGDRRGGPPNTTEPVGPPATPPSQTTGTGTVAPSLW